MKLLILDLSNNDLGPIGVSYIAEMLQENTTLMDLVSRPVARCLIFLNYCFLLVVGGGGGCGGGGAGGGGGDGGCGGGVCV